MFRVYMSIFIDLSKQFAINYCIDKWGFFCIHVYEQIGHISNSLLVLKIQNIT